MRKVIGCVAAAVIALGAVVPAGAAGTETETEIIDRGTAYVSAKVSNNPFGGPGVAKLKKNGKVLKQDPFTFQGNELGPDGGGLGYPKELYADKDGTCTLMMKFKGTSNYAPSKDSKAVKCRKPQD